MSRDWRIYLDDMGQCCVKIRQFTQGMSQSDLQADVRTFDAVVRNLEIIGEAAKHVPEEVQKKIPGVAWRKAAGLRDMLAHAYFGIDPDILWDVIQNKLPPIQKALNEFKSQTMP